MDINTDFQAKTCSFKTTNSEIETLLTTAAESNEHLKEFAIQ